MREFDDLQYDNIRKQVSDKIGQRKSDWLFYNVVAYLYPNQIVFKDGKKVKVKDEKEMVDALIERALEEI